jgi:transcriptional regulator with XRE-family HTH domain
MDFDLKKWRNDHNMSQAEFAKACGSYINAVVNYERKGKASKKFLQKMKDFVGSYQDGAVYFNSNQYKPAQMQVDDLWKFLPADIIYIAKDENGDVYGFKAEPNYNYQKHEWICDLGCVHIPLNVSFDSSDADKTLTKRPFNYFEFIGKYGIFYDKEDDLNPVFGKLHAITGTGKFCRLGSSFSYENFRPLSKEEKDNLA